MNMLLHSPWLVLMGKLSVVLALGWLGHGLLSRGNPRYRMYWWRGTACALAAVALLGLVPSLFAVRVTTDAPQDEPLAETTPLPSEPTPVGARPLERNPVKVARATRPRETPVRSTPRTLSPVVARKPVEQATPLPKRGVARDVAAAQPATAADAVVPNEAPAAGEAAAPPPRGLPFSISLILAAVGGAGIVLLSARCAFGHILMRRLLSTADPVPADLRRILKRQAGDAGLRVDVQVIQHAAVASPLIYGVRRPVILLPAWMCGDAHRNDWPGVLAHELSHVRSRDLFWQAVIQTVRTSLWWHPLAWGIRRAHALACEYKADLDSASSLGETRSYLRTLARVALAVAGPVPSAGLAMAGRSDVSRRVERLKTAIPGLPLRKRFVAAAVIAGAAFAGLMGTIGFVAAEAAATVQAAAKPKPAAKPQAATTRTMRITIVDEAGKPIAGSTLVVRIQNDRKTYKADAGGLVTATLPKQQPRLVVLTAKAPNHVRMQATWFNLKGRLPNPIPDALTFRMETATEIGGRIVNEDGKPIAGATVTISASGRQATPKDPTRQSVYDVKVVTDARGRWRSRSVPAKMRRVSLRVSHSRYVDTAYSRSVAAGRYPKLRDFSHELVMERGVTVEGIVRGPDGKPVKGAVLALGHSPFGSRDVKPKTDANGHYRFPNVKKGNNVVTVLAKGLAPDLKPIDVSDELDSVDFDLTKGKTLRVKVVNRAGKPIPKARLIPDTWRGNRSLMGLYEQGIPTNGDKDGRYVWKAAPEDAVYFDIIAPGYMRSRETPLKAGAKEHVITLLPALRVSGRVIDADTKKPIPAFTVVPGMDFGNGGGTHWDRYNTTNGRNGKYLHEFSFPKPLHFVKIEARGYKPAVSRGIRNGEGKLTIDFALKKAKGPAGIVVFKGKPVKRASVYLCTPSNWPYVRNGGVVDGNRVVTTTTDDAGRFQFQPQNDPWDLVVIAEEGYARVSEADFSSRKGITVEPWARLEGVLKIGAKPAANKQIALNLQNQPYRPGEPRVYFDYDAKTDAKGRFTFEKIPPGMKGSVARQIKLWSAGGTSRIGYSHSKPVEFVSGKTETVTLGGTGRPVTGRFTIAVAGAKKIDWNLGFHSIRLMRPPMPRLPGMPAPHTPSYSFRVKPDGSFRVEDMPPGDYRLEASVHERILRDGKRIDQGKRLGSVTHLFTVKPIPGGRTDKPQDLGTLELK